jgi:hypothetical protein
MWDLQPQAGRNIPYIKKIMTQYHLHTNTTTKEWLLHTRIHTPQEELEYMINIPKEYYTYLYPHLKLDFNNLQ